MSELQPGGTPPTSPQPSPIPDPPATPALGKPVVENWFRRMPNGGTVFRNPASGATLTPPADPSIRNVYDRLAVPPTLPTGGGTVNAQRADESDAGGND